jgi:asparagine synthase (glutamine-hydrolysing)
LSAIAGVWDRRAQRPQDALTGAVDIMANAMRARGPDGGDSWCDAAAGIALAHRRLLVTDRFPPANQPLVSSCGRYVLSGEGEVYNADELIPELRAAGRLTAGASDAHVMVEAIAAWGLEATLRRLNAMFAAALWDRKRRVLRLFRDRLGMRPLYWTEVGSLFLFASELKALRACADFAPALDRDAVAAYLRRRCVPGPHTIYRGVRMLEPGSILTVDAKAEPDIQPYWSLEDVVRAGQANRFEGSGAEATEQLDRLLCDAVARRTGKEPVGTFLSGGIDSSVLLAMLQAVAPGRAHSFTIGFRERAFDEADHAGAVARHIGATHDAICLSPAHASETIPRLPDIYDEPMADVSQIPTFFLSKLARRSVAAAFTGDGADEFFSGYEQYLQAHDLMRLIQRLPLPARHLAKVLTRATPPRFRARLSNALPTALRPTRFADKLSLLMRVLTGDADDIYRMINSY